MLHSPAMLKMISITANLFLCPFHAVSRMIRVQCNVFSPDLRTRTLQSPNLKALDLVFAGKLRNDQNVLGIHCNNLVSIIFYISI